MKFLCIGYFDPAKMKALAPEVVTALMQECTPHIDTLYATHRVELVAGVDDEARYLRLVAGKPTEVQREEKDHSRIGCVFIVEAADLDEATRLAALHPTTQVAAGEALDWHTEVRPIHYFKAGGDLRAAASDPAS